ncbi:arginine--tRNA ligase [Candidatus Saccharibacteria bacterium]|nr:arginine--tRNA ligase [Candidatus Saccharibacteria bacterium]
MDELKEVVKKASKDLFGVDIEPELARPEEQFGDYSTNVALQLAAQLDNPPAGGPREIAEQLSKSVIGLTYHIKKVKVAGPGFINFWLADSVLLDELSKVDSSYGKNQLHAGKTVVAEYSDPNPFKVLHVGHLYTSVVGDSIAKLFEAAGANVHRVNFGGDVGLHVAKTMWAIIGKLEGEHPEKLAKIPAEKRADWLAKEYVTGSLAYGDDKRIDDEIEELNKRIYQIQNDQDKTSELARIYWTTRQWSYDYFDEFYKRIGSGFEKYYPESATVEPGMKIVKANIGKVFEKSDGAVVFKGEVHNMHTRVFINSQGLPTYETKDVGLILKKWEDYHFDRSVVITANEIYEYMQVVLKAVEQFAPDLVQKTTHITHGLVKLAAESPEQGRRSGTKMSSRSGNIIGAEEVLDAAMTANKQINQQENADTALGAVKYAFLKNRIGADIIFDPAESVSLQGNSGPYLQYALVRAKSILRKSSVPSPQSLAKDSQLTALNSSERSLARKLGEYPEVVEKAVTELMPHHVCTYLYELAQIFNRFYESNHVIGDPRESLRLKLVQAYAQVLKNGLGLLNIPAPERM